jgi:hypothetical protein
LIVRTDRLSSISPGNLEPLCEVHHRTHFGVHVIPGPLWEPLRYRRANVKPPAEFVTAAEAEAGTTTVARTTKTTTVRRRATKAGGPRAPRPAAWPR